MASKPGDGQVSDHAASAALLVTKPKQTPNKSVLDDSGKLSSAGAATSLKYAKSTDLPSYPSAGLQLSSASAAASLAASNKKKIDVWKPGAIPAAEKAAYLAKDYQADPLWQPEMSKAGSKAATLAVRDGGHVEIWRPTESEHGQSAAGAAAGRTDLAPVIDKRVPADARHRALLAATGAVSGSRRRADSAPQKPPQADAGWALKAATISQREPPAGPSTYKISDPAIDASRIHNIAKSNISKEMWTSHPPVAIEVEEKRRQDTLRASAVAMAKKMYAVQQTAMEREKNVIGSESQHAAARSHNRRQSAASSITSDESSSAYPQYTNLQDAAMKLAQERLSKLQDEHEKNRMQDYYGTTPTRNRLSIRAPMRRRASSDGTLDKVDEEQSRRIRSQMSIFRTRVVEVDEQKRQKDRDALIAAAQRNVAARMSTMDEKVASETGRISEATMIEWEKKAKEKAQANSATRMENHGRLDVGGGKFIDQDAVEAVARSRLQPTFDEIAEKAAAQRARDEEIRIEHEERKRKEDQDRAREAELKADMKKAKDQEKQEERNRKAEEKRQAKEEKRKSRAEKGRSFGGIFGLGAGAAAGTSVAAADVAAKAADEPKHVKEQPTTESADAAGEPEGADTDSDKSSVSSKEEVAGEASAAAVEAEPPTQAQEESKDDATPGSPTKKSFFSRFRKSKSTAKESEETDEKAAATDKMTTSMISEGTPADNSMREVAMAGRSSEPEPVEMDTDEAAKQHPSAGTRSPSVSSVSGSDDGAAEGAERPTGEAAGDTEESTLERGRRRRRLKDRILNKIHINRDSQHIEGEDDDDNNDAFEEARDTWHEDPVSPPSTGITDPEKGRKERPTTKGSESTELDDSDDDEKEVVQERPDPDLAAATVGLSDSLTAKDQRATAATVGGSVGSRTGHAGSKFSEAL